MSRAQKRSLIILAASVFVIIVVPDLRKLIVKYIPDDFQRAAVLGAMGWTLYCPERPDNDSN